MTKPDETRDQGRTASAPSSLAPEALAGLGKLRECVAAAQNLEHLVSSREVGPKVLEQVVPDVATELEPFSRAVTDVYSFIQGELKLPEDSLAEMVETARTTSEKLIQALRADSKTQFNARRRLSIERDIRASLPPLSSTLWQVELLVEATSKTPVPMSVGELLSSTPDTGSNRPRRKITVRGDLEDLMVAIPARLALRCFGMVAACLEAKGKAAQQIQAHRKSDRVFLDFGEVTGEPDMTAEIPVYPYTSQCVLTVGAALGHFGGSLHEENSALSLPEYVAPER